MTEELMQQEEKQETAAAPDQEILYPIEAMLGLCDAQMVLTMFSDLLTGRGKALPQEGIDVADRVAVGVIMRQQAERIVAAYYAFEDLLDRLGIRLPPLPQEARKEEAQAPQEEAKE